MPKKEIEEIKRKIQEGWIMANAIKNDSTCSEGFEAADKYIKFLESYFIEDQAFARLKYTLSIAAKMSRDWEYDGKKPLISELTDLSKKLAFNIAELQEIGID